MRSTTNLAIHAALATALIAFAASSAAAADAYLKLGSIKGEVAAGGCTGEGCDDSGQPALAVLSWSWGATQQAAAASNLNSSKSNREASAPSVSEIAVNDPGADGKKPDRVAAGDVTGDGRADVMSASASSPRDAASGLPTGKRQHKPITITKDYGAKTIAFPHPLERGSVSLGTSLPGCATGKHYDEATLVTRTYKYEFKDVIITSCAVSGSGGGGSAMPMESVSFNYTKVDIKASTAADRSMWDLKKQQAK